MTPSRLIGMYFVAAVLALNWFGSKAAADLFVSPEGRDTWSGRQAQPNQQKTDGPLATLAAAIEASRKEMGVTRQIVLGPGRFYLQQPLTLDSRDSGLTIEGGGPGRTIVYGGQRITNWRPAGEHLWVADVPEVKQGTWDFRALVVNDRLCLRARLPETGRFEHETRFPVRWMSSAGGGWERKPTREELTTLQYRGGDLGPWLSVRNAEITVYHMWDESMVGLASHDPATRTLIFSQPAKSPPGAFAVNTFAVWNVREGLTQPGQWYLDRDKGQIVYWPLPGEKMSAAVAVAPRMETIIEVKGSKLKPVRNFTLQALTLSATTTPCKPGSFGAAEYRGSFEIDWGESLAISGVEITNVAGYALRGLHSHDLRIENCDLHHLGAGGCRLDMVGGRVEGNRIHHVGLIYPSALGLLVGGAPGSYTIRRNEIHHTSYSGMCIGGSGAIIEENLLHHCMQELHDGAAIYAGGAKGAVIRRNVARDIVEVGNGYGVSSYYLDEKCRDCVVEKNVSMGVARPVHNHMTLNCTVRDNVFICDRDMDLSFARSAGFHVTGNIFQLAGKLKIGDPDAVTEWKDNLIVQAGNAAPALSNAASPMVAGRSQAPNDLRSMAALAAISDAMPVPPLVPRQSPRSANVVPMPRPPAIDGKLEGSEWPPGGIELGELPDQHRGRGAPLMAKLCADAENLYVAVVVVSMFPEDRRLGHAWGRDEGVELTVQGARADGRPVTYVLRGFTSGYPESLTLGGATPAEAQAMQAAMAYAATVDKQVWRCEWRVPLAALRFMPRDRAQLPLNVTVFRSENNQCIQWAGSLGETWDLRRGGRLVFHDPKADAAGRPAGR